MGSINTTFKLQSPNFSRSTATGRRPRAAARQPRIAARLLCGSCRRRVAARSCARWQSRRRLAWRARRPRRRGRRTQRNCQARRRDVWRARQPRRSERRTRQSHQAHGRRGTAAQSSRKRRFCSGMSAANNNDIKYSIRCSQTSSPPMGRASIRAFWS